MRKRATSGPQLFSSAVPLLGYAAELFGLGSPGPKRREMTLPNADLILSKETDDELVLPPYGPPYNDESVIAKQVRVRAA